MSCRITCVLLNIRSLRSNLLDLLCTLEEGRIHPDIIILTETWIHTVEEGGYTITGYNGYYTSQDNNRAGGVAIYVKTHLTSYKVASYTRNADICVVNVALGGKWLQIIGGYRSPNPKISNVESFVREDLPRLLNDRNTTVTDRIWAADANINLDKSSSVAEDYLNLLAEYGYDWAKTGHTRVNNRSKTGTTIDHVFIKSINVDCNSADTLEVGGLSDHLMVKLTLTVHSSKQHTNDSPQMKINWKVFDEMLARTDVSTLYNEMDPSKIAEMLGEMLERCYRQAQTAGNHKQKTQARKPWITPGILAAIRTRNKLWQKCKRYPDSVAALQQYKIFRNRLRETIRQAENTYIRKNVENAANVKEAWRFINSQIRGRNITRKLPACLQGHAVELRDLDRVNKFFSGTDRFPGITQTNVTTDKLPIYKYDNLITRFEVPSIDKIATLITELPNGKAPGMDNLSSTSLKKNCRKFAPLIQHLAIRIFATGIYPLAMKRAVVSMIYKKGSPEDLKNYRPISLLGVINKIIEKTIVEQLSTHLEDNKLLSEYQFGFRKGRNTEQAVLCLQEYALKAIDEGLIPVAVFLDFTCAFDTVPRPLLIAKLEIMGVSGLALKLINSYLTDRTQMLKVGNRYSSVERVEFGVPQGGTLAPLLFIAYVNDLLRTNDPNQLRIGYADDTTIVFRFKGEIEETAIESALCEVQAWTIANGLCLNSSKSKYIVFGHQIMRQRRDIRVHCPDCKDRHSCYCASVSAVPSIKYLGIEIDEKLGWHENVKKLKDKLRAGLSCIAKLKRSVSITTLKVVYRCLIESYLRYGILAYGAAFQTTLKSLEVVQNACVRKIVMAHPTDSVESLYKRANVYSLKQLYFITLLQKLHIKDTLTGLQLISEHQPTHLYNTRRAASGGIYPPAVKLERTRRYYTHRYLRIYNDLPSRVKDMNGEKTSIKKKRIREYVSALSADELTTLYA